jgi:hypothetical protein
VFFDNAATDRIEKATGERVTSYLRSLVYLRSYKFVILPPNPSPSSKKDYHTSRHRQNPELVLYAYDWQKFIGSRDDPLYHEEATYLLSDFTQYSVDGDHGRVPRGYGTQADEAVWRKQENEALVFLRSQWESIGMNGEASTPPPANVAVYPAMETPNRQVLISMLHGGMNEDQRQVFNNIRGTHIISWFFPVLADASSIVFGINPLEELDLAEIQKVLLASGVKVIPEEEVLQSPVPPIEYPTKPKSRRKACRKSTGRRPPRSFKSPITDPVVAASPPPVTQPLMTQMVQDLGDPIAHDEFHTTTSAAQNQPLESGTSFRRDEAVSRKRKRRVVEFFSSTSPEPHSKLDHNEHRASRSTKETRTGRQQSSKASVGRNDVHSSPRRSPLLTGLVTQLPVSSMDAEDESPASEPLLATQQVVKLEDDMDVDPLPTQDERQDMQDVAMDSDAVHPLENDQTHTMRHRWELDDDEDGLGEADFDLKSLLER